MDKNSVAENSNANTLMRIENPLQIRKVSKCKVGGIRAMHEGDGPEKKNYKKKCNTHIKETR